MFKKTQDLAERSRARLKSSDLKKLKAALSEEFDVSAEVLDRVMPAKEGVVCVKLSNKTLLYLHQPSETPLFFDRFGRQDLYPSLFILWQNPTLLKPLFTHCGVVPRLLGGADLMLPGVIEAAHDRVGAPLSELRRGEKRAVFALGNPNAFAVGEVLVRGEDVVAAGLRGKGLQVQHVYGDLLYERGNREAPAGFGSGTVVPTMEILADEADKGGAEGTEAEADAADGAEDAAEVESWEVPEAAAPPAASDAPVEITGDGWDDVGETPTPTVGAELPEPADRPLNSKERRKQRRAEEMERRRAAEALAAMSLYSNPLGSAFAASEQDEGTAEAKGEDEGEGGKEAEDGAPAAQETEEEERPLTREEMDDLLRRSFLQALRKDLRNDSKLPILANVFYASMLLPRRPENTSLNIRKTSFKKFSRFLQSVEEEGLVVVEDGDPGQEWIVSVDRDHDAYREHRVHRDEKTAAPAAAAQASDSGISEVWGAAGRRDLGARLRPVELRTVFRLAGNTVPMLQALLDAADAAEEAKYAAAEDNGVGEGGDAAEETPQQFVPDIEGYYSDIGDRQYLSAPGLRKVLGDYMRLRDLSDPTDPRSIRADEPLLKALYLSMKKAPVAAGGRVGKKEALTLWQSRAQSFTAVRTHELGEHSVVKGLEPPKVTILMEKMGKHYSCHVSNLDTYNIDLSEFTRQCSRRFAASATVGEAKEGKPGQRKMEVHVQGNLSTELPQFLLSDYGIPARVIEVVQGKGMVKKKKKPIR